MYEPNLIDKTVKAYVGVTDGDTEVPTSTGRQECHVRITQKVGGMMNINVDRPIKMFPTRTCLTARVRFYGEKTGPDFYAQAVVGPVFIGQSIDLTPAKEG
jgi:hypothetical protein